MLSKNTLKSTLIGIWILNCLFGIAIAIKEIWLPSMNAAEDKYAHIAADPFDGTVMPLQYIPNWSKEPYRDKSIQFSSIPKHDLLPIPQYDTHELMQPITTQEILRSKFTYTVLYMGSYKLNYKEYDGSHLGVDIRSVIGMPVHAIANGVVIKTVEADPSGNKYVVIRHDNIPVHGRVDTIFSSYLHLSSIDVHEGEKVQKGAVIGRVGTTGLTTTPHLHFQIDTKEAPFHPYWPYTGADTRKMGISFLAGVNAGLGKENAQAYTIHPMDFVQQHLDTQSHFRSEVPTPTYNPHLEELIDHQSSPPVYNPHLEDIIRSDRDDIIVAGNISSMKNKNCHTGKIGTNKKQGETYGASCILETLGMHHSEAFISRGDGLKILMQYIGESPKNTISDILDIPLSDPELHGYAHAASRKNILRGDRFFPERIMTHAEFVELLYRSGVLTRSYPKHQYHNISREHEFFNSAQAYAQSILHPQKEFHPESLLTQESAIRILDALSEK